MSGARAFDDATAGFATEMALALSLCAVARLGEPKRFSALTGGRNNRAFKVELTTGEPVALKCYSRDARDGRDRLGAEWAFLRCAGERGVDVVPRALAKSDGDHAALYSFIEGQRISGVTAGHVDQALAFIASLNRQPRAADALAPASEACFSLAQHLATVDRRVARLSGIAANTAQRQQALLIKVDLEFIWARARARIVDAARSAGLTLDTELSLAETCLSPSDFGFHNALEDRQGRLTFLDFEYAGRDDPAKLVCDFLCQPEMPVADENFETFNDAVMQTLGLGSCHGDRARMLRDAYRVKWICIMLNDFLPIGAARRGFADPDAATARCELQLVKARRALARLSEA